MAAELCKDRTKNDLDDALRQLLEHKPLDQIRIRELTALCGIRRQSFYYHFPDVWALFDWSLKQEEQRLLIRQETCLTWKQVLVDLLNHTARHRKYYQALLESRGRAGLREIMREPLRSLLDKTLDYYQRRCGTAGIGLEAISKKIIPFIISLIVCILLVTYVEPISLILPQLLGATL